MHPSLSASSSNPKIELYTAEIDWPEGSPSAFDIYSSAPEQYCALLEDPNGSGRDFLVSKAGQSRSLTTLTDADAFIRDWKESHRLPLKRVPGIRQIFYAAYEAGGAIEKLPAPKASVPGPLLWVHDAHWGITVDNRARKLYLATLKSDQHLAELTTMVSRCNAISERPDPVPVDHVSVSDGDIYQHSVAQVKAYIAAGDIFQANIARFWHAPLAASQLDSLYRCLRHVNPAPFACLIKAGDEDEALSIISASPERLYSLAVDRQVETRPIAGTRRRGEGDDDEALKSEMLLSDKEKAEHIMLLDLERNDLGRVCEAGSVEVNERMVVEQYSTVQHIVSNVRGILAAGKDVVDLFMAMFPGGTITGCPKVRCMEIIHEMEDRPRGPYTGGVGYIGWDGSADMNILIRTFWHQRGTLSWAAGAGIVADSDAEAELEETDHKAAGLLRALNIQS